MGLASDIKGGKYQKAITYIHQLSQENRNQLIKNINTLDKKGYSLLHHLMRAKKPSLKLVDLLCSLGSDPNIGTRDGKTPLDLIIESSSTKKKSDSPFYLDETTLSKAVMFLSKGVELQPQHAAILIHSAIELNNSEYLTTILAQPYVNINAKFDSDFVLPLHRALKKTPPNPEIVQLLLDHDALLADRYNNPSELPTFNGQILEMIATKSQENLQGLNKNRKHTAVCYTDLSDNRPHTIKTFLKANTLCEASSSDTVKLIANDAFTQLLSFKEDYFIQLLMSAISLAMLDGLTIYAANAPSVFPLYAHNVLRGADGYFIESSNQILLGGLVSVDDLALTIAHEGLHAILTKAPKELAHMCKPYAHKDRVHKQEYMEVVEESRRLVQESTLSITSKGKAFVEKVVFENVDSTTSPYVKHSQKLQEYIARTVEARVYSLQHPLSAKDIRAVLSPLFDYLDNNVAKILEAYIREHPRLTQVILPEAVTEKLQIRSKPLHSSRSKVDLHDVLDNVDLTGLTHISLVSVDHRTDSTTSFVGKISNNSQQTDSKLPVRVQTL